MRTKRHLRNLTIAYGICIQLGFLAVSAQENWTAEEIFGVIRQQAGEGEKHRKKIRAELIELYRAEADRIDAIPIVMEAIEEAVLDKSTRPRDAQAIFGPYFDQLSPILAIVPLRFYRSDVLRIPIDTGSDSASDRDKKDHLAKEPPSTPKLEVDPGLSRLWYLVIQFSEDSLATEAVHIEYGTSHEIWVRWSE